MSGLWASIRLYGLVRNLGSSDNPHRQPVDILCTINPLGGKAIRLVPRCRWRKIGAPTVGRVDTQFF
jgi:hypothetical protein